MIDWLRPRRGESAARRFQRIAHQLLYRFRLAAGEELFLLAELEFYLHSPAHPDPFVHCHPLQQTAGRWYFHRVGTGYRGGTFKGLDLTFGTQRSFGGILLRAIQSTDGLAVRGPCRVVDRLLQATGHATVAALDAAIAARLADDTTSPLHIIPMRPWRAGVLITRPRVGLSLARATPRSKHQEFLHQPYNFRTNPVPACRKKNFERSRPAVNRESGSQLPLWCLGEKTMRSSSASAAWGDCPD